MTINRNRLNVPFKAPIIPQAPQAYNKASFDATNNVLRLYFNQLDNALREISSSSPSSQFTYDAEGNLAKITSLEGEEDVFSYNADGFLTQIQSKTGTGTSTTTFSYNADGQLTSIAES